MTYSKLLSLILLLAVFVLPACQEEETGILELPAQKFDDALIKPSQESTSFVAETTLSSDERTVKVLGQEGHLFFRVRPKGCPVRIAPLCDPGFEWSLTGVKGLDLHRLILEEISGLMVDPKTESIVAVLTQASLDPETGGAKLFYEFQPKSEVASDQFQVTFGALYDAGQSIEHVAFEGFVTSEIIEPLL